MFSLCIIWCNHRITYDATKYKEHIDESEWNVKCSLCGWECVFLASHYCVITQRRMPKLIKLKAILSTNSHQNILHATLKWFLSIFVKMFIRSTLISTFNCTSILLKLTVHRRFVQYGNCFLRRTINRFDLRDCWHLQW